MRVLGLDLGTNGAFAVWDGASVSNLGEVKLGLSKLDQHNFIGPEQQAGRKLWLYREELAHIIDSLQVLAVGYEDVTFQKGPEARVLPAQRGVIQILCAERRLLCAGVPVPTLKKYAGHGKAKKEDMLRFAIEHDLVGEGSPWPLSKVNNNHIDAIWVAHWLWSQIEGDSQP